MKLKKILASLTAAAMAVSVMAITPVSVSAADPVQLTASAAEGGKSVVITYDVTVNSPVSWEQTEIIIKSWNNDESAGDYFELGLGGADQEQWFQGDTKDFVVMTDSVTNQTYTYNFKVEPKNEFALLVVDPETGNYVATVKKAVVYDATNGTGNVVYSWDNPALDTTVYEETGLSLSGLPTVADNTNITINIGEGKDIDLSKWTEKAKLKIYYTSGNAAGWGNVQIVDNTNGAWNGNFTSALPSKGDGVDTSGAIALSLLENVEQLCLQNNNGAVITKVVIMDEKKSTVAVDSITLDKENLELTEGDEAVTLTATVLPEDATDKTVTWTSSDETIVTVVDGKVTPVAAGTATVTAKAGDKTAECAVIVNAKSIPAESITLSDTAAELTVGKTVTLTATIAPENTTDTAVTWSSDNEAVATVEDGVVTAVAAGTAKITVAAGDVSAECTVTVKNPEVPTITDTLTVKVGAANKIVLGIPDGYTFPEGSKFTSDDETIATVAEDGTVTGVKAGTVKVWYAKDTASDLALCCVVTVSDIAVESVSLDKTSAELEIGATAALTATVKPDNATVDTAVTWSSDNEAVATVKDGVVTAVSAGTANITAAAGGKSAVCAVTVKAAEVKPEEPKPEEPKPEVKPEEPKPEEPKPEVKPEEPVGYIAPIFHVYPSNGSTTNENIWTGTDTYEARKAPLAVRTAKSGSTINIIMGEKVVIAHRILQNLADKSNVTLNLMFTGYTVTINSDDIDADKVGNLDFANGGKFLSKSERDDFAGADEVRQFNFSKADMSGIANATVTVEFRGGSKKLPVTFIDRNGNGNYTVVENSTVSADRTASFEITEGGKYVAAVGDIEISDDISADEGIEAETSSAAPAALALAVVAAAAFVVLKKVRA